MFKHQEKVLRDLIKRVDKEFFVYGGLNHINKGENLMKAFDHYYCFETKNAR